MGTNWSRGAVLTVAVLWCVDLPEASARVLLSVDFIPTEVK